MIHEQYQGNRCYYLPGMAIMDLIVSAYLSRFKYYLPRLICNYHIGAADCVFTATDNWAVSEPDISTFRNVNQST